jgi:solute carrier family 25 phosphate transporter 23/24/25/41
MAACAATYPLDLVRTRLAAQTTSARYVGLRHALATIHAEEGTRGLYRGLGATLVGVAPSLAINFAVYETLRSRAAAAAPGAHPAALALAAGSAAGAVSAVCCFPLDLVRRRMQLPELRSVAAAASAAGRPPGGSIRAMPAAARAVLARDGLRGFYRGIVPELGKVVPGVGIAFSVYEFAKRQLGVDT